MLYTVNIPVLNTTVMATFVDDTYILVTRENLLYTSALVQKHLNKIHDWVIEWNIRMNQSKSQ